MNTTSEQAEFLSWKIVPARLDATQAAWFLGFELHEIPILVAANLLKPLGHPARNSTKFFATQALEQLRRDEKWLARASDAIATYCGGKETPASGRLAGVVRREAREFSADRLTQSGSPVNAPANAAANE
jgi:hypothetical protein